MDKVYGLILDEISLGVFRRVRRKGKLRVHFDWLERDYFIKRGGDRFWVQVSSPGINWKRSIGFRGLFLGQISIGFGSYGPDLVMIGGRSQFVMHVDDVVLFDLSDPGCVGSVVDFCCVKMAARCGELVSFCS